MINRHEYPALLYFVAIALISRSKFDAIFQGLSLKCCFACNFWDIQKCKKQLFNFLFNIPSLFKMIFVFKNLVRIKNSIVNYGWESSKVSNNISCWNLFLFYICCQQIVYRTKNWLVLLLHFQFLTCARQQILLIKDHRLHKHVFVCKNLD